MQDIDGSSALSLVVLPKDDGLTAEQRDSEADRIRINQLHQSILYNARLSLEDGILIGEILAKRKAKCGHGKWIPWLKANVEFTEATACNYIRLFENAEWLKSKNVLDLTDARLQLKAKSKAEGGNPKPRGRGSQKTPKERSSSMMQEAVKMLQDLWYCNDNGRTLQMRDGDLQRWVEKAEVVKGESTETIAQEAYRLWKLSVEAPKERSGSLTQKATQLFRRHYGFEQLQRGGGLTSFPAEEALEWVNKVPVTKGETALTIGEEAYRLREASLSVPTSELSADVLAPEPPNEPQEPSSDDSDDSSPNEPLVTVEQSEESKRQGHVENRNGFPIHCSPKPYHLTIHRPQNELGGWPRMISFS